MAIQILSPMMVNFPSLLYSFSENERVKNSRNVTFFGRAKALGLFLGGEGCYKIAEIHVLMSNTGDLETTTSGYLVWNNEVSVVLRDKKRVEMMDFH